MESHRTPALIVGKKDFLAETDHKAHDAFCKLFRTLLPLSQLSVDGLVLNDRACDQLRKHRYIGAVGDNVRLYPGIASVHIDDIGDRLEGIETDADGKSQAKERDVASGCLINGAKYKVSILEKSKQRQSCGD